MISLPQFSSNTRKYEMTGDCFAFEFVRCGLDGNMRETFVREISKFIFDTCFVARDARDARDIRCNSILKHVQCGRECWVWLTSRLVLREKGISLLLSSLVSLLLVGANHIKH